MLDLPVHHIGIATRGIDREQRLFSGLGYTPVSGVFTDTAQGIRGLFMSSGHQVVELLENIGGAAKGRLDPFLQNGIKMYHIAYQSGDIETDCARLLETCRARLTVPVTDAVFFDKVCFAVLPNLMIVELVQLRKNDR